VRLQEATTQELIATYQAAVLRAGREAQTVLRGFLRAREQAEGLALAAPVDYGHLTWGLPRGFSIDVTTALLTR
jgi:hypothetical protein